MTDTRRLVFVSPRFLFPADSGGKIRTGQILRGMLGGRFHITLLSPAPEDAIERYGNELRRVSDRFVSWPEPERGAAFRFTRLRHLLSGLPVAVATDRDPVAAGFVARELASSPDVVVFDFPHSAVIGHFPMPVKTVMFTHNVEAEIYKRHAEVASNPLSRGVWRSQYNKMQRFERTTLGQFDTVVAVSERDAEFFRTEYGVDRVSVIPTGVDLDFFRYHEPADTKDVVFIGSMDWLANVDAMDYLLSDIWPLIIQRVPEARMVVVGRNPPPALVERAQAEKVAWQFTGFVDDIRPYVKTAALCVIPLRVGGGTRIKAYEAMAMGAPMVSTGIGVEGLPLEAGHHFIRGDSPGEFATGMLELLENRDRRHAVSRAARDFVQENFPFTKAAAEFQQICLKTIERNG